MRKPLIAANWKENKTEAETVGFCNQIEANPGRDALILPSYVLIPSARGALEGKGILLGSQDMSIYEGGAYSGEVSADMLKGMVDYVMLGHSERRLHFGETNSSVNKKVKIALAAGLKVIICIGETAEEHKEGISREIVLRQLNLALDGIAYTDFVIAYEPVWAISGGDPNHKAATADDAQDMHGIIRARLRELYGENAENTRIIYGGSAKPENIKELMSKDDIDGALVGTASLDVESFQKLVDY